MNESTATAAPVQDRADALYRLLKPLETTLRAELASALVQLQSDQEVQDRYKELASRNSEGLLTAAEGAELQGLIEANDLLAVLKAVAQKLLASARAELETQNREAVRRVRAEMLERAGWYTGDELPPIASADCDGIFSVIHRGIRKYPKFQFTGDGLPFPEMKDILAVLPDVRGWDRLQWFLEPHEVLNSRTPLELWSHDRAQVVKAARTEHWGERL